MKKTLAALIVSAFAASAANAAVIYDNEGTKVQFGGSIRVIMEKTNFEDGRTANSPNKRHSHAGLRNAGSRFHVKATHQLDNGYYALGYMETRFDSGNEKGVSSSDSFGDIRVMYSYVGLGNKDFGEVKFGRQLLLADDLSTADDYSYGILGKNSYIPIDAKSAIRYDYKGIEGLDVSASYQFADKRNQDTYEVENGVVSNGVQVGAIYKANGIIAKLAYGRTNYKSGNANKHHVDGVLSSFGYDFGGVIVSLDSGYAKTKKDDGDTQKRFFVSPGFQYQVTDASRVYGNYKYEQIKEEDSSKVKQHGFLLGVDYKLHKQVVTYLEGKYQVKKSYDTNGNYVPDSRIKDKAIGVGMRVFF